MSTDLILPVKATEVCHINQAAAPKINTAFIYQTDLFCLYSVSVNKPQGFLLMFPLKSLKMS